MSSVIRQSDDRADVQSLVALNLCDCEQQAREAVDAAREQARKILAEAVNRAREAERVAAARGEKAGYEKGRAEGREAGRTEALEAETQRIREATASVRQALLETLGQVEAHRHEVLADAKQNLVDLAVAIAERICRTHFEHDAEALRSLVAELVETTGRAPGLVLLVNPADAEAAEHYLADVYGPLAGNDGAVARVVGDENVERGGCIAERTAGRVDATVETQLRRIVSELLGQDHPLCKLGAVVPGANA